MLVGWSATLLSLAAACHALKASAPFFMVSSDSFDTTLRSSEVRSASEVQSAIAHAYANGHCKTGYHVLISQPGLTVEDLRSMKKLSGVATSTKMPWQIHIPNVLGELDADAIRYDMSNPCGGAQEVGDKSWSKSKKPQVAFFRGETLPEGEKKRKQALQKLDEEVHKEIGQMPDSGPLVVVFASAPAVSSRHATQQYESDQIDPSLRHQELKRDDAFHKLASNSSSGKDNFQDGLPLFERYQYLSPALFMGLSVFVLLFIILYVAISAIAGLDVSYKAFDKEMAPQNQKKQQ